MDINYKVITIHAINEGFGIDKVPKPKFNIGEEAFFINSSGNVEKVRIHRITQKIKLTDDGCNSFSEYSTGYEITTPSFVWIGFLDERDLYSTLEEVPVKNTQKPEKQHQINNLIKELIKLINSHE